MKSSSESILAVVDAGVPRKPFFRLTGLAEPGLSVVSEVAVGAESVFRERWDVAVRCPWAAGRGSLSMAASAAVLFRVVGGVVNEVANLPGVEVLFLRHTSLDKTWARMVGGGVGKGRWSLPGGSSDALRRSTLFLGFVSDLNLLPTCK